MCFVSCVLVVVGSMVTRGCGFGLICLILFGLILCDVCDGYFGWLCLRVWGFGFVLMCMSGFAGLVCWWLLGLYWFGSCVGCVFRWCYVFWSSWLVLFVVTYYWRVGCLC